MMITDSLKLAEDIRGQLENPLWIRNGKLPSLRQIASQYSCPVHMVKSAIDHLQQSGLLVTLHGKGVYLKCSGIQPVRKSNNRVIGVIVLENAFRGALESLKNEYLQRGFILSEYNAAHDNQSPLKEREFLLNAREQKFDGLLLVASPYDPVNTDLFVRLRNEGMKVAHLSVYTDDMRTETCFLYDFQSTGRIGTAELTRRGYRRAAFLSYPNRAPYWDWLYKGVREITAGLSLPLEVIKMPEYGHYLGEGTEKGRLQGRLEECRKVKAQLLDLPQGTAICCPQSDMAHGVMELMKENKREIPEYYGIVSLSGGLPESHFTSHYQFDAVDLLRNALEYMGDDRISSTELIQYYQAPVFADRGTL